jgi:microcystin-dependent protein
MVDLPIGSIVMFDGVTPPAGWYDCDGYTRNGITTPNLIGAFPMGVPISGGSLGATGGSTTHIHTNLASGNATHGHGAVSGNSGVSSGSRVGNIWAGSSYGLDYHQHLVSVAAVSSQETHNHTVPNTDSGSSLPPYIRLRYIMRCE